MRLLFDQNLSRHLVRELFSEYPGSEHVVGSSLDRAADIGVWKYAAENGLVIVSKDSDFLHLSMLRGHPPKVILLEVGNCSTSFIENLLKSSRQVIEQFCDTSQESFLILSPKETLK